MGPTKKYNVRLIDHYLLDISPIPSTTSNLKKLWQSLITCEAILISSDDFYGIECVQDDKLATLKDRPPLSKVSNVLNASKKVLNASLSRPDNEEIYFYDWD